MPVHLASVSRRTFLAHLGGAVAWGPALRAASAAQVDPDRIAILNDTHIGEHHPEDAPIPTHLRETVAWLVGLERRPATVIINGDLSLSDGQPGDYRRFAELITPLREAGIPVHLTLGNHDDRDVFVRVLQSDETAPSPVLSKHVGLISLPKANLFLLDSLNTDQVTKGVLGQEQLLWLSRLLTEHADKPAWVFAHHNPRLSSEAKGGLQDSAALWDLLVSHPHVKAYVHGHLHQRNHSQHRGIHILDTPATSFVTRPAESTTGWTLAQLSDQGGEVTTFTHLKSHPWNRAVTKLAWRSA